MKKNGMAKEGKPFLYWIMDFLGYKSLNICITYEVLPIEMNVTTHATSADPAQPEHLSYLIRVNAGCYRVLYHSLGKISIKQTDNSFINFHYANYLLPHSYKK